MFKPPKFTDYSKPKLNSLSALPIAGLADICNFTNYDTHVDAFFKDHGAATKTWIYPQALAHVAKWRISRNASNKYSAKQLVLDNVKDDAFNKGLYWILMSKHRALQKQYQQTEYCSMTPLILSAFLKLANIKYSEWDTSELHFVVDPKLLEAMLAKIPHYTKEELLQFRVQGLVTSLAAKNRPGQAKSPVTTYGLTQLPIELPDGRAGPGALPGLVRMMLCQTWCAHPLNRNHYMILDPDNWDKMPEPLVTSETEASPKTSALDDIWK